MLHLNMYAPLSILLRVFAVAEDGEGKGRGWKWFVVWLVVLVVVLGFLAYKLANPIHVDEEVSKRLIEEAVRESHLKVEWKRIASEIREKYCLDPWCYVEQVDERTYRIKPMPLYVYGLIRKKLPEPRLATYQIEDYARVGSP